MQWASYLTCAAAVGFHCQCEGMCVRSAEQGNGCGPQRKVSESCHPAPTATPERSSQGCETRRSGACARHLNVRSLKGLSYDSLRTA